MKIWIVEGKSEDQAGFYGAYSTHELAEEAKRRWLMRNGSYLAFGLQMKEEALDAMPKEEE